MTGRPVIVPEAKVYPPDVDLMDMPPNAHHFRVLVQYRGRGLYCITKDDRGAEQMTHTGKWLVYPLRMTQLRWCRFPYERALELAQHAVLHTTVHGLTYQEWGQFGHRMTPEAQALIRARYRERYPQEETP